MKVSGKNGIALIVAALLALGSVFYFANKSLAVYKHGYFDLPIFTQAAIRYWKDEPVYQRGDDLAELYKPGAIVYKFPPLYLFNFLPWFDASGSWHPVFRAGITYFFISMYALLVFVSCRLVLQCRVTEEKQTTTNQTTIFVLLAVAYVGVFAPFFVVQGGTSGEAYIIALAVLAFASMQRFPYLAGFLLIWLASIKLYPVFLLIYPLLTRQWKVLFAAAIGGILIVLASVLIFGREENRFYLQNILPILLSESVSEDWTAMFKHTTGNQGIVKVLVGYGLLPSRLPVWLNTVRLPFVFAMIGLLLQYCKRHDDRQWQSLLGFVLVVLTMMICLPNVFYSYFVMLLFPILVLAGFLWVQQRWSWLFLLAILMSCFIVDDSWTYSLSQSAFAAGATPEMLAEVEAHGVNMYLWNHHRLLFMLWFQGLATPFLLYVLWIGTAIALRVAAFNRRHTPV